MSLPNKFDKNQLIDCGHGRLFGPGNAQLPVDNMLMLDRINHIAADDGEHGKGSIIAELDINPDLWFFKCHFPGDPVMPGCLGLDAMWQLVGFFLGWKGNPGKAMQGLFRRMADAHRFGQGALPQPNFSDSR